MLERSQLDDIFSNAKPVEDEEPEAVADLAGYQVTRAELFSHTYEPAITIWPTRIKFNMACLRRFPGVTHIQILIHPEQRRLIIRPCLPDAPDSLRWAKGGGEKELSNRDMLCRIFAGKVFDLMKWDSEYRYKMMGRPAVYQEETLFLFNLTDFELFMGGKSGGPIFPESGGITLGHRWSLMKNSIKLILRTATSQRTGYRRNADDSGFFQQ